METEHIGSRGGIHSRSVLANKRRQAKLPPSPSQAYKPMHQHNPISRFKNRLVLNKQRLQATISAQNIEDGHANGKSRVLFHRILLSLDILRPSNLPAQNAASVQTHSDKHYSHVSRMTVLDKPIGELSGLNVIDQRLQRAGDWLGSSKGSNCCRRERFVGGWLPVLVRWRRLGRYGEVQQAWEWMVL